MNTDDTQQLEATAASHPCPKPAKLPFHSFNLRTWRARLQHIQSSFINHTDTKSISKWACESLGLQLKKALHLQFLEEDSPQQLESLVEFQKVPTACTLQLCKIQKSFQGTSTDSFEALIMCIADTLGQDVFYETSESL